MSRAQVGPRGKNPRLPDLLDPALPSCVLALLRLALHPLERIDVNLSGNDHVGSRGSEDLAACDDSLEVGESVAFGESVVDARVPVRVDDDLAA